MQERWRRRRTSAAPRRTRRRRRQGWDGRGASTVHSESQQRRRAQPSSSHRKDRDGEGKKRGGETGGAHGKGHRACRTLSRGGTEEAEAVAGGRHHSSAT